VGVALKSSSISAERGLQVDQKRTAAAGNVAQPFPGDREEGGGVPRTRPSARRRAASARTTRQQPASHDRAVYPPPRSSTFPTYDAAMGRFSLPRAHTDTTRVVLRLEPRRS
jgi:hypothetical protein